jgi:hypothetical protein
MGMHVRKTLGILGLALALGTGAAMAEGETAVWDGTFATDYDLEMVVYAAYNGAREYALTHDNYFLFSGADFPQLRRAMIDGLKAEKYGAAKVKPSPVTNETAAIACGKEGETDLRVKLTSDGAGILLVAVSSDRMAAYEYDPEKSADIIITHSKECEGTLAQAGDPDQTTTDQPADDTTQPADDTTEQPADDTVTNDTTEQPGVDQPATDEPAPDENRNKDKG